jgi:hypothetical protein
VSLREDMDARRNYTAAAWLDLTMPRQRGQ